MKSDQLYNPINITRENWKHSRGTLFQKGMHQALEIFFQFVDQILSE